MGVDVDGLLAVMVRQAAAVSGEHLLDILGQGLGGGGFLDDDVQDLAHGVTLDHVAFQGEHPHATLIGEVQQAVARHEQVLHGLEGGHTDGTGFDLGLDGPLDLVETLFDLGSHALLLGQLFQGEVIDLEAEEGRVRGQQGQQEFAGEVVHATGTHTLVGRVVLGGIGVPIRGNQSGQGVLRAISGTDQERVPVCVQLLVEALGHPFVIVLIHQLASGGNVEAAPGGIRTSDRLVDAQGVATTVGRQESRVLAVVALGGRHRGNRLRGQGSRWRRRGRRRIRHETHNLILQNGLVL